MNREREGSTLQEMKADHSPLARWAGALLLASALFALAAVLAFGTLGQHPAGWAFVAPGLLCLLGWFVGRKHQERLAPDSHARQRSLHSTNAVLSTALILLLLMGLNYIAGRRHKTFDLTSNQINSLSEQTQRTLGRLPRRLQMTYVFVGGNERVPGDGNVVSLLNAYAGASHHVRVDYLNAALEPLRLRELNLQMFNGQPTLLLQMAAAQNTSQSTSDGVTANTETANRQQVSMVDEQNITSAVLKLLDPQPRTLYFLSGHGELVPADAGAPTPINAAAQALQAQNYRIKVLSLRGKNAQIPAKAAALLVVAPQVDLAAGEAAILQKYLSGQGRLMLLFDTPRAPLPRWRKLVQSLGLVVEDGFVIDPQSQEPQIVTGTLEDRTRHPILRGVNAPVVFPGVAPMRANPAMRAIMPLFLSSPRTGSARTQGDQIAVLQGRTSPARSGPFVLAAAYERPGGTRAVVVANSLFATDRFFSTYGNASFWLASLNWTVGQDTLVSIPPKAPVANTLSMPDQVRRFAQLFSLLALPVVMLIIGLGVWWKRR